MSVTPAPAIDHRTMANEQEAIAQWLVGGPAQLASGPHAGAVAGVVDADHRARYAYPEITGYYLQWLAWRASYTAPSATLSARAGSAQRWLVRWLDSAAPPPTRVHLDAATEDWRNDAV